LISIIKDGILFYSHQFGELATMPENILEDTVMRKGVYSTEYQAPSVFVERGDKMEDVIQFAREIGAIHHDSQGEWFIVQFGYPFNENYAHLHSEVSLRKDLAALHVDPPRLVNEAFRNCRY
jgi:hypothetical protein